MPYRVQWLFEGVQPANRYGGDFIGRWSEGWYSTSNPGNLDGVIQYAAAVEGNFGLGGGERPTYLVKRLACLPDIYQCSWVRVTELDPNGKITGRSKLANVARRGFLHTSVDNPRGPAGAAQLSCALLVIFTVLPQTTTDRTHNNKWLLCGLPLGCMRGNVIDQDTAQFHAILQFLNFLGGRQTGTQTTIEAARRTQTNLYSMRFQKPEVRTWLPLTQLTIQPGGRRLLASAAGMPLLNMGNTVQIRSAPGIDGVNRRWTCRNFPGTTEGAPVLLGDSSKQLTGTWQGSGFIRADEWTYALCDQYLIVGLRSRKRGSGPFKPTVGRRRRPRTLL